MLSLVRLDTLLVAGAVVLASSAACSSGKSNTPGGLHPGGGTGGSAGTAGASGGSGGSSASGGSGGNAGASGGTGGAGAGGGTGGTAGGGGTAGITTTDAGAGTGGTGGAAGSDGGIPPIDQACTGGYAFQAAGAAFTFPTPKNLGVALGSLTYDYKSHPITVVVHTKSDGSDVQVGASVTETSDVNQVFPAGMVPTLAVGSVSAGGFSNTVDQDKGWIAVVDQTGTKYIEIDGIHIVASTSNNCTGIIATLTGIIPASAGSVTLDLPSGSTTVSSLAGGSGGIDGGVSGWNVRMLFTGESTDFDFSTL